MPLKPLRPCKYTGCPALTANNGYCEQHKPEARAYDRHRGTAAQRGYGGRWQKYRLRFLKANPLCVECLKSEQVIPAKEVDHIQPVMGPDDPLFWDAQNHQALCKSCHSRKTARENGGMGNAKG